MPKNYLVPLHFRELKSGTPLHQISGFATVTCVGACSPKQFVPLQKVQKPCFDFFCFFSIYSFL